MKNNGNWMEYKSDLKKELANGFYDIKLDNGEIRLVTFDRYDGRFHSNATGEACINTEKHIIGIRESFI